MPIPQVNTSPVLSPVHIRRSKWMQGKKETKVVCTATGFFQLLKGKSVTHTIIRHVTTSLLIVHTGLSESHECNYSL